MWKEKEGTALGDSERKRGGRLDTIGCDLSKKENTTGHAVVDVADAGLKNNNLNKINN